MLYGLLSDLVQRLGCWSLASRRYLPVSDLLLTCDHFMGKLSAVGQPTNPAQLSIPSFPSLQGR